MILENVTDLIGNTPLIKLPVVGTSSTLYLKNEKANPGGSMKDRMARNMVQEALRSGALPAENGVIVESSSGNTAIGLALTAIEFGLRFIAIVDHHASPDKIAVLRALGAEIRYVEGNYADDEVAVVERQRMAAALARDIPGALFMNQSDNPANADGYNTFAREAINQLNGAIDSYVGCVGTGGSMTGIARALKAHDPNIVTLAVEPAGSIVFGQPGHAYFQSGTGTPKGDEIGLVLDFDAIDYGDQVTDSEAFETARYIARRTGLLVGGSTGGTLYKALEYIHKGLICGNVLIAIADGGEKYLGTTFNETWLRDKGLLDPLVSRRVARWLGGQA